METALDPTSDVILAYKQNGEYLHPDHGYPLRCVRAYSTRGVASACACASASAGR